MSGGRLVVVDRAGRDVKRFALAGGLATLGSDPACDIRFMLPTVAPHHATVVVHAARTVVRNVGDRETLVNGREVSVAALRHRDVITIGDRALRWEYDDPHAIRDTSPAVALAVPRRGGGRGGRGRGARRAGSAGGVGGAADRAVRLALEMRHRATMPGSTGGKQVAVVQPQRRDNNDQAEKSEGRASPQGAGRRSGREAEPARRKSSLRASPKNVLQNTTKATLWIESRKTTPRNKAKTPPQMQRVRKSFSAKKSTPLRLTVLKKAQSAQKVIKIEAPLTIDHTKQAAIMLMTGHTPKSISPKNQLSPSFLVKKPSPVRKTPRGKGSHSGRRSKESGSNIGVTPSRGSTFAHSSNRSSKRSSDNQSVTILEITDSTRNSTIRASNTSTRSGKSPRKSPSLLSPKKSSLKDLSKKSKRKTESIKFDLSNLVTNQGSNDVFMVTNTTQYESDNSMSEEDLTLHYSESSNQSPSPRKSINSGSSRSSKMFAKLGTSLTPTMASPSRTLTTESPRARKSIRGSTMVQKALETSMSDYSKMDNSANTTVASAFRTRTLSPRSNHNMESYSVVDLVSLDSNDTSTSVYNSAGSVDTTDFGTPQNSSGRKTRSTINPTLLGSSTPYVGGTRATRSKSSSNITQNKSTKSSVSTRRSKSLSTPENKYISVNSTKVSRASRSRSRINDSDLLLLDDTEVEDSSPKTSKRTRTTKSVTNDTSDVNLIENSPEKQGVGTPENRQSPEPIGTPVLSIQSLLNSSQSSLTSQNSGRRGKRSANYKRKTIGVLSEPKRRQDSKSKSLGSSVRKTWLRLSSDSGTSSDKTDADAPQPDNEEMVTPKSAVKISPEAVKNKHSTAKKPQSKRSIIDDLNQSDIVKQLFNSPVKRKLSQSMTAFSRKQLFEDDDEDIVLARRPTRNTVALTGRTPNNSLSDQTESITPERFVSPIQSPSNSPNLSGLRRLFKMITPEDDLRNVRGVKSLLRTPRTRASIKNDLTKVHGGKAVFAKSPRNSLSDVRVKEVFAVSPNNDLRRVSGVKSLFQRNKPPKNDLTDVRGVKKMFQRKSPENDLRNVSGVKRTMRNTTPKNDLTDLRGVRRMFRQEKPKENYHDVSGIEELFDESNQSRNRSEDLFDMLVEKPPIKSVYSKTFSTKLTQKPKTRQAKSLHSSIDLITNNVEEWLEHELQKRLHKDVEPSASTSISRNNSKNTTVRELQKLATDTLEGGEPLLASRTRNSSYRGKKSASEIYSSHILPIKKRSVERVEASLEKSKHWLPIKKRAVVHSTPVKGCAHLTMNASELGRVSPIAADRNTADRSTVARSAADRSTTDRSTVARSTADRSTVSRRAASRFFQTVTDDQAKGKPAKTRTPRKQETPKKIEISKPSPKKSPEMLSPPKRTTRNKKITETTRTNNTKKRRTSLVIAKKAPVMSPQADPQAASTTDAKQSSSKVSPKKTRVTRGTKGHKLETLTRNRKITENTRTNTRKRRTSLVIAKKAPVMSPQADPKAASTTDQSSSKVSPKKTRVTRVRKEHKLETPRRTRARASKATAVVAKQSPKLKPLPKEKAATKSQTKEEKPNRTRKNAAVEEKAEESLKPPQRSNKKAKAIAIENEPQTRGRKTNIESPAQPKRGRKTVEEEQPVQSKRGRKTTTAESSVEENIKTRGKTKAVIADSKTEKQQSKTRGKKDETQASVQFEPTRGRKRVEPAVEEIQPKTRGRKVLNKSNSKDNIKTRGTNVDAQSSEQSEPATRGRRHKAEHIVPETTGRKRKAAANEEVSAKVAKPGPKRGKRADASATRVAAVPDTDEIKKVETKKKNVKNTKQETSKSTRGTRSKQVEVEIPEIDIKPVRGRKAAEPKGKVVETTRGKRKANMEPSPAKVVPVAAKKAASKASAARGGGARGEPQPEVPTKAVGRSRRR